MVNHRGAAMVNHRGAAMVNYRGAAMVNYGGDGVGRAKHADTPKGSVGQGTHAYLDCH